MQYRINLWGPRKEERRQQWVRVFTEFLEGAWMEVCYPTWQRHCFPMQGGQGRVLRKTAPSDNRSSSLSSHREESPVSQSTSQKPAAMDWTSVPPNSQGEILTSNVMVLTGRRWLGHEGEAPHEWDSCPYNRGPTELPHPVHMWGHSEETVVCEPGRPHHAQNLLAPYLGFPNCCDYEKFLLFISCPISGVCYSSLNGLMSTEG